jgi:large subunit ribosomal protein L23
MNMYQILKRPILTEKSNYQADQLHSYTFEVDARANKLEIRSAVEKLFNVKVLDVNIIKVHGAVRRFGRYEGKQSGYKKALVKLAQGNSISFFEGV